MKQKKNMEEKKFEEEALSDDSFHEAPEKLKKKTL